MRIFVLYFLHGNGAPDANGKRSSQDSDRMSVHKERYLFYDFRAFLWRKPALACETSFNSLLFATNSYRFRPAVYHLAI
jgi:hypothetical protein